MYNIAHTYLLIMYIPILNLVKTYTRELKRTRERNDCTPTISLLRSFKRTAAAIKYLDDVSLPSCAGFGGQSESLLHSASDRGLGAWSPTLQRTNPMKSSPHRVIYHLIAKDTLSHTPRQPRVQSCTIVFKTCCLVTPS